VEVNPFLLLLHCFLIGLLHIEKGGTKILLGNMKLEILEYEIPVSISNCVQGFTHLFWKSQTKVYNFEVCQEYSILS
jgi:hypothetical protein